MQHDPAERIARWVRPKLLDLSSYHVPESGGYIKLDAMESPYPWPDDFVSAWLEKLRSISLNRYCDPTAGILRERLREFLQLPDSIDVMLGNGSDELIQILTLALGGHDRMLLSPEPGFVMYRMIATATGSDYAGVALNETDFSLNLPAMLEALERHQPAIVFIAYPNNPTGNLFKRQELEQIIEQAPGIVVIDEAYSAFASDSFMTDLDRYDNLLVMGTFSKMGFAGLRLGYLAGHVAWLEQFDKVRLPYNIGSVVQVTTVHALDHMDIFQNQAARIRADRSELLRSLASLEGVTTWDSETNFILFRVSTGRAGEVFAGLKSQGVLIKQLDGSHAALHDCLRVTVGTPEENRAFRDSLASLL